MGISVAKFFYCIVRFELKKSSYCHIFWTFYILQFSCQHCSGSKMRDRSTTYFVEKKSNLCQGINCIKHYVEPVLTGPAIAHLNSMLSYNSLLLRNRLWNISCIVLNL